MKALIIIAFAAAAALPAMAASVPTDTGASTRQADQAQPRLVCHHVEALSGSHVSMTRVCRTAAQWRAMHDGAVDDAMSGMGPMTRAQDRPVDGYSASGHH